MPIQHNIKINDILCIDNITGKYSLCIFNEHQPSCSIGNGCCCRIGWTCITLKCMLSDIVLNFCHSIISIRIEACQCHAILISTIEHNTTCLNACLCIWCWINYAIISCICQNIDRHWRRIGRRSCINFWSHIPSFCNCNLL